MCLPRTGVSAVEFLENLSEPLDRLARGRALVTDDLARRSYEVGISTRKRSRACSRRCANAGWTCWRVTSRTFNSKETLIAQGREDRVILLSSSYRLFELIDRVPSHVFGHCGCRFQKAIAHIFKSALHYGK